jgi:hypothetical protein
MKNFLLSVIALSLAVCAVFGCHPNSQAGTKMAPKVANQHFTATVIDGETEYVFHKQRGQIGIYDLKSEKLQKFTARIVERPGQVEAQLLDGRTIIANLRAGTVTTINKAPAK